MKNYKTLNNLFGWISFIIAAIVYLLTIEPTASFWDCGEFISSAFKLEVGHPPGAPFFMIVGRFFTLFAGGNVTKVAPMINSMSALASAGTILFLFWTITHLANKLIGKENNDLTFSDKVIVIGSGLVGALAYTFSDTFWFSAVEGEVYASSSFFTAIVFWAILKWENAANEKYAMRWIILIAYLMGLSIGVHLLNLLAIPAIVMVFYFKKFEVSRKGVIWALIISFITLGAVMYGIIPGLVTMASKFELLFVNGFGLPYNSGVLVYGLLLISSIIYGIVITYRKEKNKYLLAFICSAIFFLLGIPLFTDSIFLALILSVIVFFIVQYFAGESHAILNTIIVSFAVIVLGYSSFAMIIIRSNANPPMDQNNPETLFNLLSYLNREQYGDRPLFHGPYYNAPILDTKETSPKYTPLNGKYEITASGLEYVYDKKLTTFFPRMYSRESNHVEAYKRWAEIKGSPVKIRSREGMETVMKPTMVENIRFFVRYQIGWMYLRYFMWNFAGRQNDIQGHYKEDITKGNWLCGIPFIDEMRLGPQDKLPDDLKNNRARNKYYCLPLILGLIGAFFHYKKNKKDFWVVMLLFFFTGIAIVLYLNQYPFQPRERDYAYAGSFYVFAIWIGLGVWAIIDGLKKYVPAGILSPVITVACLALVPGIMAAENWDDHDRSDRYTARDFAKNYLESCAPNAILFTNGDNDTFPLWYAQEVEGIRTDVRVINLSYLGASWYIEQMENKVYDSPPVKYTLTRDQYRQGNRDVVYLIERVGKPVDLKEALKFVASDKKETKTLPGYTNERVDYFPAKTFILPYDSANIFKSEYLSDKYKNSLTDIQITLKQQYVTKNHLMVLDILATNNWERPVYYAITVSSENYLELEDYFIIHGLASLVAPVKVGSEDQMGKGKIDSDVMYDNIINKFEWGGVNNPKVYLDENNRRMLMNFRNSFARLAVQLLNEGKQDSALTVLDKCVETIPDEQLPYSYFMISIADMYYKTGNVEKATDIVNKIVYNAEDQLEYYLGLPVNLSSEFDYEKRLNMQVMQELIRIAGRYKQDELRKGLEQKLQETLIQARMNPNAG